MSNTAILLTTGFSVIGATVWFYFGKIIRYNILNRNKSSKY